MKNFQTLCIHPLREQEETGMVTAPTLTSTAYNYLESEELRYPGFYSTFNQKRLGKIIANLESGSWGIAFSSGMAAITTAILSVVKADEHIVFSKDLYGGTWKFAEQELVKRNISFSYADNSLASFQQELKPNTKLFYLETPSNPLLRLVPLKEIATLAQTHGITTIVDNTFASPVNQRPIQFGIDIVVHSGTKYLGGHNDLPYGALVARNTDYQDAIFSSAKLYGGSLAPHECYLAERSIKTLALRVQRQNANAFKLAEYLHRHSLISRVYYPGLPTHEDHALALTQMTGFGGMLAFELDLPPNQYLTFLKSLKVIQPAVSLGGVESLICSPAATSHRAMSPTERLQLGIKDNLLRLSVGVEDANDLITDLRIAIRKASNKDLQ
ncbi:cystathionine gamma-synthase [Olivibacter ginsenosidimutans]|uniref:cysteine-S-conjugate beta-lyase n=1 Tax=Olivibacter ginsenosidimutans TaxID=1176537 RepID=A0ABP9B9P2_9SPHI